MQSDPLPFARLMGINVISVEPDLVVGELKVRDDLCTRPAVLHGGAVMAFADTIGAIATVANDPCPLHDTVRCGPSPAGCGVPVARHRGANRRIPNETRGTRARDGLV